MLPVVLIARSAYPLGTIAAPVKAQAPSLVPALRLVAPVRVLGWYACSRAFSAYSKPAPPVTVVAKRSKSPAQHVMVMDVCARPKHSRSPYRRVLTMVG